MTLMKVQSILRNKPLQDSVPVIVTLDASSRLAEGFKEFKGVGICVAMFNAKGQIISMYFDEFDYVDKNINELLVGAVLANCTCCIVVTNCKNDARNLKFNKKIVNCMGLMEIVVLDHIIVDEDEYQNLYKSYQVSREMKTANTRFVPPKSEPISLQGLEKRNIISLDLMEDPIEGVEQKFTQAFDYMVDHLKLFDRERLYIMNLNGNNKPLNICHVSQGGIVAAHASPRDMLKSTLLSKAKRIIMFHNHPSGDPTPSENDLEVAWRLYRAGRSVGISVMDSIVVGGIGAKCDSIFQRLKNDHKNIRLSTTVIKNIERRNLVCRQQ